MYNKILLPVDSGEVTNNVINYALEIGNQFKSTMHILGVIDTRRSENMSKAVGELGRKSSERQNAEQSKKEVAEESISIVSKQANEIGLETKESLASGEPAEVILSYAENHDISLVVISAAGRSAVGKFVTGNTAGKIARGAKMPVLLVRENE